MIRSNGPARIGVAGPVGTGKTPLVCWRGDAPPVRVVLETATTEIYTSEDAEFLVRHAALPADRIVGVETGGCPHAAIRDDPSLNEAAIADLSGRHPGLQLVLLESGGDNLSATFSPELVDASIFVIDVAGGDKIPRKGGPGICRSDLLVINKTDLAPLVGASLQVMADDAARQRGDRPFVFTNLRGREGMEPVLSWIESYLPREP